MSELPAMLASNKKSLPLRTPSDKPNHSRDVPKSDDQRTLTISIFMNILPSAPGM